MEMVQESFSKQKEEVYISFEGEKKTFAKHLIEEENYDAGIKKIEAAKMPVFGNPNKIEDKIIFMLGVRVNQETIELPLFLSPVISEASKGGKAYSNSKLFDILQFAGLIEKVKQQREELKTIDGLRLFLSQNLINRPCRVEVKTSNKGTDAQYSRVSNIKKFL